MCATSLDERNKVDTCGGIDTYSMYIKKSYYLNHGHLLHYQIEFYACEKWKAINNVKMNTIDMTKSSSLLDQMSTLNTIEKCAAKCLDQNITTEFLAFNGEQTCICMSHQSSFSTLSRQRFRDLYVDVLSNSSCNKYCKNSNGNDMYNCGSTSDPKIFAIYHLNGSCPNESTYISEINQCVIKQYSSYYSFSTCPLSMKEYVYDGSIEWSKYLKILDKLQLYNDRVIINFDNSITPNITWKCGQISSSTTSSVGASSYFMFPGGSMWNRIKTAEKKSYFVLNGCLKETEILSYRSDYRLCLANPLERFTAADNSSYILVINQLQKFCAQGWIDINNRCFKMTKEEKSISTAKNICISNNDRDRNEIDLMSTRSPITVDDIKSPEMNSMPSGRPLEYESEWEARLGFYLLDEEIMQDKKEIKVDENDQDSVLPNSNPNPYYDSDYDYDTMASTRNGRHQLLPRDGKSFSASIYEYYVLDIKESVQNSSRSTDEKCMLVTRASEGYEKPKITVSQLTDIFSTKRNNCSQPRHVLCETNPVVIKQSLYECFQKPFYMDLPALITNQMTHERCLSTCQELQTKLAIININRCYCVANRNVMNITQNFQQYKAKLCGSPCSGNSHELCGDKNIIVIFQMVETRRTYTYLKTPAEAYPDFTFRDCLTLDSNSIRLIPTIQFTIKYRMHPRHCLALCSTYEQKYALIQNRTCLCTNINVIQYFAETGEIATEGQNCALACDGNYLYSCGSVQTNIYSLYIMQPKCKHGYEMAENYDQCVYSHYSSKTKTYQEAIVYCQGHGGTLAEVNDIVEIQDILPDSILHTRLMNHILIFYKFKYINDTRYFWLSRTTSKSDNNTISERILKSCSDTNSTNSTIDTTQHCIVIKYITETDGDQVRCIEESNKCETTFAMPVCVDKLKQKSEINITDPIKQDVNVSNELSCDIENYHYVGDYCYKVNLHELSWMDAVTECERDQAQLFVPDKSIQIQLVRSLLRMKNTYTPSGLVHVGVYYDAQQQTVYQYASSENNQKIVVPDSNAIYDVCDKTFRETYQILNKTVSFSRTIGARTMTGCGYIDYSSSASPTIQCDDILCAKHASFVCQKLPKIVTMTIQNER
ncbi:unnamed protein product [Didymodactylos carnosus]|nr:unnamed protein product [Didymodactylos carnosus]CAF3916756.1 unnamed protein product [Didymodactylos carnosus]